MLTFTMLSSVLFHATCCHSPWRCVHLLIFICALPYNNIVVPPLLTDWWYYRDKPSIYGSSQEVGLFCYLALLSTYCKTRSRDSYDIRGNTSKGSWCDGTKERMSHTIYFTFLSNELIWFDVANLFRNLYFSYWYTSHNFRSMQDHMGSCYNEFCIIVWESIINIMTNVDVNC